MEPMSATEHLEKERPLCEDIRPLNHVQVALLKRHRAGDAVDGEMNSLNHAFVGIAAGLRNSG